MTQLPFYDSYRDGVAAAQSGNPSLARIHLADALRADTEHSGTWLWLAWLADSPSAAKLSLEQIKPDDQYYAIAQQGLGFIRALQTFEVEATAVEVTEAELVEFAENNDPAIAESFQLVDAEVEFLDDEGLDFIAEEVEEALTDDSYSPRETDDWPNHAFEAEAFDGELSDEEAVDETSFEVDELVEADFPESELAEPEAPVENVEENEDNIDAEFAELVTEANETAEFENAAEEASDEAIADAETDEVETVEEVVAEFETVEALDENAQDDTTQNEDNHATDNHVDEDAQQMPIEDVTVHGDGLSVESAETNATNFESEATISGFVTDGEYGGTQDLLANSYDVENQPADSYQMSGNPSDDSMLAWSVASDGVAELLDDNAAEDSNSSQMIGAPDEIPINVALPESNEPADNENNEPVNENAEASENSQNDGEQQASDEQEESIEQAAVEAEAEAAEETTAETPRAPLPDFDRDPDKPTVLVCDDSPTVRKLVSVTLSKSFNVIQAEDGAQAWDYIEQIRPDLVIADIKMPVMDGFQLCHRIKRDEGTRNIPVIILSSKDGMVDKLRGKLVGCTDHMGKPFTPRELLEMVRKHVAADLLHTPS